MTEKRRNEKSILESTLFMYIALILTRVLGLVFNIPFYDLLEDSGYYVYSCAYTVYNLFLDISTLGIPIAMSIIISEYNSLKKYKSKAKAYRIGQISTAFLAIGSFIFVQLFARKLAGIYYVETDGVTLDDIVVAIRIVAVCLLVIPFLGIKRGYLQGHRLFDPSSLSQLVEQVVRVVFVLASAYIVIKVLNLGVIKGVYISLVGTIISGVAAIVFINNQIIKNKSVFDNDDISNDEIVEPTNKMIRKIWTYCVMVSSINVFQSIHMIVRINLLNTTLMKLGFSGDAILNVTNNVSQLAPRTCLIISSLSMALTTSVIPHVSGNYAKNDYASVRKSLNQSVSIVLAISTPLSIGMFLLASPVHAMFYKYDAYGFGALILQFDILLHCVHNLTMVFDSALQGMNRKVFVCVSTIICYSLSIMLEVPLIYLFNTIGFAPYLGAMVSSIIGHIVLLILQSKSLKETVNYNLRSMLPMIKKLVIPLCLMTITVVFMKFVLPIPFGIGRLKLFLYCLAYAIIGGSVYALAALKTGALEDLMQSDRIKNMLNRISMRIKKKN